MSKGSKTAQSSFILKPGKVRPRDLFLHFFDVHFLEERGTYAKSDRAIAEMELAVRFAVILGSQIFVPAASYYETLITARLLRPYLESDVAGLFRLVGGGSSLDEFRFEKLDQYRQGSLQHTVYSCPLQQTAGWARRGRSATKDIAGSWIQEPSHGLIFESFRPFLPDNISDAEFKRIWLDVPERLGREAFIVDHILERLPVDSNNLTVQNMLHSRVNSSYFNSYAQDYGAAIFQKMSFSGSNIPSGCPVDDVDFSALFKMSRAAGLLDRIRNCPIHLLETIAFIPEFQEVFSMSQTDGPAAAVAIQPVQREFDLAILTALPKEREAVEAVFGEGVAFSVRDDPHLYKSISVNINGIVKNVVVAVLSSMGNTRSGITSANFIRSFKTRHLFMVGIAGGMPNPDKPLEHVRLGDVVIGQSLIESDFQKRTADGKIEVRDIPQRLSHNVHQLVANFRSERTGFDTRWLKIRDEALKDFGIDPANLPSDIVLDIDGKTTIDHPHDVRRLLSPSIVHFGRIAAGNTLLKDPVVRNDLQRNHGAIAVEMEGAGIRDAGWAHHTEVGVIRGIVDYCDTNKSDDWHMIAAISAASVARFLFERLVEAEPSAVGA